jgi:hypothetical protein
MRRDEQHHELVAMMAWRPRSSYAGTFTYPNPFFVQRLGSTSLSRTIHQDDD